jgi:O-antigen ligase
VASVKQLPDSYRITLISNFRQAVVGTCKCAVIAVWLSGCLFYEELYFHSPGFFGVILRDITPILSDIEFQKILFLSFGCCFITFYLLRRSWIFDFWFISHSELWLVIGVCIGVASYFVHSSLSLRVLTLLAGPVIGQGFAIWICFKNKSPQIYTERYLLFTIVILVILLAAVSARTTSFNELEYNNFMRWTGLWESPNLAGLLMGTGLTLEAGIVFGVVIEKTKRPIDRMWSGDFKENAILFLCFISGASMERALLLSYSRGAWVATACGLAYLLVGARHEMNDRGIKNKFATNTTRRWLRNNIVPCLIISISLVVIYFWHFRQTDFSFVRRAFSIFNENDFSWRNRVSAWEGSLQMTAEHPWLGTGWNQPETLYQSYYLGPKLIESAAIEMNDHLMLGATIGIFALFCFELCFWLSITQKIKIMRQDARYTLHWLQTICRAGAIVLLVGFWFDGGLFKLVTASIFWILLELGRCDLVSST